MTLDEALDALQFCLVHDLPATLVLDSPTWWRWCLEEPALSGGVRMDRLQRLPKQFMGCPVVSGTPLVEAQLPWGVPIPEDTPDCLRYRRVDAWEMGVVR